MFLIGLWIGLVIGMTFMGVAVELDVRRNDVWWAKASERRKRSRQKRLAKANKLRERLERDA